MPARPNNTTPTISHVAILLATYNGERYLPEQLASFARQTHKNWRVWASDDGSTDNTRAILEQHSRDWGPNKLTVVPGPRQGSSRNFVSLTHRAEVQADHYAYSDQDDIWEDNKLARALAWLSMQDPTTPALYCTRTRLVDARNNEIGLSPNFRRPPGFANALMQNITGGNTMVFNDAARRLLRTAPEDTEIVIHDWWTYLAVTACGGTVHFDPEPGLRYRQHDNNLIGMTAGGPSLRARITKLFGTTLKRNTDVNLNALNTLAHRITPQNREILDYFIKARRSPLLSRLWGYRKARIYRLTTTDSIGMAIAAVLNRL
ncbi:glycosyltransferase [Pusillimonas sp. TS35]|nr:glycosyltransferase [Pusillimonas sp. TS35]